MNALLQTILALAAVGAALAFLLFRLRAAARAGRRRPAAKPGTPGFVSRWKGEGAPAEKSPPPRSAIAGLQDFEDAPAEGEEGCAPAKCAGCRGCG